MIILPWANLLQWEIISEKLRGLVYNQIHKQVKNLNNPISISIWITTLKEWDTKWKKATERADTALYEAKNTWKNKICSNTKNPWEE